MTHVNTQMVQMQWKTLCNTEGLYAALLLSVQFHTLGCFLSFSEALCLSTKEAFSTHGPSLISPVFQPRLVIITLHGVHTCVIEYRHLKFYKQTEHQAS